VADTVAFCDTAPESQAVLTTNRQTRGVPVLPDVKEIDAKMLRELAPDTITGGFPCQDISSMNMSTEEGEVRAGLDGPRSRLFFEIPRLVRASRGGIKHVFLENSPRIIGRDSDRVIEELRKVGMKRFAYGVFAASDVGALHRRRRWFLVATSSSDPHHDLPLMRPGDLKRATSHPWTREDIPRVVPRPTEKEDNDALITRSSLLGNSVVPQTVALAFQTLVLALRTPVDVLQEKHRPATPLSKGVVVYLPTTTTKKTKDGEKREQRYVIPRPEVSVKFEAVERLHFDLRDADGHSPSRKALLWMTPRHNPSTWGQTRILNNRTTWNLADVIYYDTKTREQCPAAGQNVNRMSDHCTINPEFIENMMGYPLGWTAVVSTKRK